MLATLRDMAPGVARNGFAGTPAPRQGLVAVPREATLSDRDLQNVAARLYAAAGIVLGGSGRDLVQNRLARRLRQLRCGSFADYLALLDEPGSEAEQVEFVNALTTNLTGFFREAHHFEALEEKVLAPLRQAQAAQAQPTPGGRPRLRIWSAACSSGEEPYSIAMTVHRALPDLRRWDARILATDIDTRMIEACRAGRYGADKAAKIPAELQRRYVRRHEDGDAEMADALRELIRFKKLNLLEPWPMQGPFDAIFCRNVLIYFDKDTQAALFDRFADMLKPAGHMFIGHSETMGKLCSRFQHVGRTIYRRVR